MTQILLALLMLGLPAAIIAAISGALLPRFIAIVLSILVAAITPIVASVCHGHPTRATARAYLRWPGLPAKQRGFSPFRGFFVLSQQRSASRRADVFIEVKHLTNRCSQPLAVLLSRFDFMRELSMFGTIAPASGG